MDPTLTAERMRFIDQAHRAYMACALWSSTGDDGEPLDKEHTVDDIATSTVESMRADVRAFLTACWGGTWDDFTIDLTGIEPEQFGHDYWLTRNRHGAGFWDRGDGDRGVALTDLAHADGSCELYVGDDGKIHSL